MVNSILAAIISFILPGIGEIIQGQSYKGGVMFLIFIILLVLSYVMGNFYGPYFAAITFIYAIIAAYDTYKIK